jgi:hypothetical protein
MREMSRPVWVCEHDPTRDCDAVFRTAYRSGCYTEYPGMSKSRDVSSVSRSMNNSENTVDYTNARHRNERLAEAVAPWSSQCSTATANARLRWSVQTPGVHARSTALHTDTRSRGGENQCTDKVPPDKRYRKSVNRSPAVPGRRTLERPAVATDTVPSYVISIHRRVTAACE